MSWGTTYCMLCGSAVSRGDSDRLPTVLPTLRLYLDDWWYDQCVVCPQCYLMVKGPPGDEE